VTLVPASKPAYRLTLGSTTLASSGLPPTGADLVGLAAGALGASIPGGAASAPVPVAIRADADLAAPAASLDVWLGSSAGLSVAVGDPADLELGYNTTVSTVFTGTVDRVEPDLARLHIQALTGVTELFGLRVNQVYENQTAGQIVSDLAGQAGLSAGTVQDGPDLPFYAVDDARTAYQHCRDLAERAGFDLFVTPAGELTFATFDKAAPDHRFTYARDVLSLEVRAMPASAGRVEVWGESPASSEGAEAASWLVRDFSSSVGGAGTGTLLRVSDPAIRTKAAADASAGGRLAQLTRRATFGTAVVLGAPGVAVGDAVAFADAPDDRLGGTFQVKRVTHRFGKSDGFTTRLELWGGAGGLGDLLGGLL
jgi:hypothetical protein